MSETLAVRHHVTGHSSLAHQPLVRRRRIFFISIYFLYTYINHICMRALILHTNQFSSTVVEKSTRPPGIVPEPMGESSRTLQQCVVVFFCVEKNDTLEFVHMLYQEVVAAAKDFKVHNILISPFAHLSKNIADTKLATKLYETFVSRFDLQKYTVQTSQFGYHKSLLLDIKGHPGAFRYREYS